MSGNDEQEQEPEQEPEQGTQIRVLSKYGYSYRSLLSVEMVEDAIMLNWRSYPEKLGAEIFYVKTMTMSKERLTLLFEESFELSIEFDDEDTCDAMHSCLEALHLEALEMEKEKRDLPKTNIMSKPMQESRHAAFQIVASQEMLYQLTACLRLKEGDLVYRRLVTQRDDRQLSTAFYRWTHFVKQHNLNNMNRDRQRWRLHAIANQELDLQAWYHAVFYSEVYRLRGPFWYKDALLPSYRTSYDIVDNTLTPLEEAALAHVLCSPDTVYADVAGQMFVVQALTTPHQFSLFQGLASQGSSVIKYPRQGRPARKLFRFSFVEGKIYLTWKGKFGNQGVDLGEVSHVSMGIGTDVLKKALAMTPQTITSADHYLSVVCAGRSVDLCFDKKTDRDAWGGLLGTLCNKEHGSLVGISSVCPPVCSVIPDDIYEWGFIYEAIGSHTVPHEARENIINLEVSTALTSSDATTNSDIDVDLTSEGKEEHERGGEGATTHTNTLQDANKSTLENSLSKIDGAKKGQRILLQRKNPLADAKSHS